MIVMTRALWYCQKNSKKQRKFSINAITAIITITLCCFIHTATTIVTITGKESKQKAIKSVFMDGSCVHLDTINVWFHQET